MLQQSRIKHQSIKIEYKFKKTRKHCSRIHTAYLPTVCASVATRCLYVGGPQVNKFEQVSSDGHKMSLAGRPHVWKGGVESGILYSEVQCIMGNGHLGPPYQND